METKHPNQVNRVVKNSLNLESTSLNLNTDAAIVNEPMHSSYTPQMSPSYSAFSASSTPFYFESDAETSTREECPTYEPRFPFLDDELEMRNITRPAPGRYCICIVSDFFFPRLGGVELHQFQLSQALLRAGHKVIVVTGTHSYTLKKDETVPEINGRQGIRHMAGGLKVYYCPQMSFHNQASLPTLFAFTHLFRQICVREKVDIVHGHQTTAPLAHEALFIASSLGLRTVFTDHSLFSLNSIASIHVNKLMEFTLRSASHVIAVSHTLRENLVLRANLDPNCVSAIPNALDVAQFTPNPANAPPPSERVVIVVVSRLVYRKGVDLIIDVIPPICSRFPNVDFIIGGCGPKEKKLRDMVNANNLHSRVKMYGEVDHSQVRTVLTSGHIFLNCSLTESFCIAILEAVACGLHVVATRVGGVPEILPDDMINFAEPNTPSLIDALCQAIPKVAANYVKPYELHERIAKMYSWHRVASRTEKVYEKIMSQPRQTIINRCEKYLAQSFFSGMLWSGVASLGYLAVKVSQFALPNTMIDIVPNPPEAASATSSTSPTVSVSASVALPTTDISEEQQHQYYSTHAGTDDFHTNESTHGRTTTTEQQKLYQQYMQDRYDDLGLKTPNDTTDLASQNHSHNHKNNCSDDEDDADADVDECSSAPMKPAFKSTRYSSYSENGFVSMKKSISK